MTSSVRSRHPSRARHGLPAKSPRAFVPDIVRDSQYYVLQITDYGAKLADILMSIHEPDPEDESIRQCHRVTAGQMILDRVLGPAANLQHDLPYTYDPDEDPYWAFRHPAEIDSQLTPEELKEADRLTRNFIEGMKKETTARARTAQTSTSASTTTRTESCTSTPTSPMKKSTYSPVP